MDEPPDPFRSNIPDFGDPLLNDLAAKIASGTETARALVAMDDVESLLRAILALREGEARAALMAFALSHLEPGSVILAGVPMGLERSQPMRLTPRMTVPTGAVAGAAD